MAHNEKPVPEAQEPPVEEKRPYIPPPGSQFTAEDYADFDSRQFPTQARDNDM